MTADREALIRQTALEIGAEVLLERALVAEAERDKLKAELEAAETVARQRLKRWNDCSDAYRKLEAERDQYREALQAVAESKFATEPHRIARDALESISPAKT